MIGDFTLEGSTKAKVLLRALGSSLQDPTLELATADGSTIAANDNWQDTQKAQIEATGLAPNDDNDTAIVTDLDPGSYRAIVRGKNKKGSVTLELYTLP